MLTVRIIPCLDIKHGQVVKGVKFANLNSIGCPVECAKRYYDQGADELVLLDIAATIEERSNQLEVIKNVREQIAIPLTVGGGIKKLDDARQLFEAGADKVSVNSAAVDNPDLLTEIAYEFGNQSTVLALDAVRTDKLGWELVIRSGSVRTGIDAIQWAIKSEKAGVGEILLTSFDMDGSRKGYDTELIQAVSGVTNIPIIASGGASTPDDFIAAIDSGADGLLAASIFHYGTYTIKDIKILLADKGKEVRL